MKPIPVAGPWITEKEIQYVADAAQNAWYENAGSYLLRFEEAFAKYIGVRYAVSVPHCTAAIHLSLLAAGVGPGDEVIVPDVTWIATAAPIQYVGAQPIFADICESTWCLTPDAFERCITPRTKAVIPVDLYGSMPQLDLIKQIAARQNIVVIEDAAEAFGSEYLGRRAGAWGDTGVFSFHGSKTMTTGEGGMLVTDREDIYRRVLVLRDHGRAPGDTAFFNQEVAYKYRMSNLQAAFGLAQVERAEELVDRKREIFAWYEEELGGVPTIKLNAEPAGTKNSYWMTTVVFDASLELTKDSVMQSLKQQGIDSRPFFYPLSSLPAYAANAVAAHAQKNNVHGYRVSRCGVNLPCSGRITREEVAYVCQQIRVLVDSAQKAARHRKVA